MLTKGLQERYREVRKVQSIKAWTKVGRKRHAEKLGALLTRRKKWAVIGFDASAAPNVMYEQSVSCRLTVMAFRMFAHFCQVSSDLWNCANGTRAHYELNVSGQCFSAQFYLHFSPTTKCKMTSAASGEL